jgi:uncharacterized damage-inducible protein DinB
MSRKDQFLSVYDREHETTMRVLRAYPPDQLELRPHPKSKNARELAWTFALECGLAAMVWNDAFAQGMPPGAPPSAPGDWNALLEGVEAAHRDYRQLIASASDDDLAVQVQFFVGPRTLGPMTRHEFIWMMLHDQIHHRGQFTVYLRMANGKVPSVYGPTADEPWA